MALVVLPNTVTIQLVLHLTLLVMSNSSLSTIIGCLVDASDSVPEAFQAGPQNEQATERLLVVPQVALQIARTEHVREPDAVMFVGTFRVKRGHAMPDGHRSVQCH